MKCCCLSNLRVQIAPDCILEYLNFQIFPGGACPRTPSVSHTFEYYTYSQLCPTKWKFPGAAPKSGHYLHIVTAVMNQLFIVWWLNPVSPFYPDNQTSSDLGRVVKQECTVLLGTWNFRNFKAELLLNWKRPLSPGPGGTKQGNKIEVLS